MSALRRSIVGVGVRPSHFVRVHHSAAARRLLAGVLASLALASVAGAQSCPGDMDGDGSVGSADMARLLDSWGSCRGCDADLDGDGAVDNADLVLLLDAWGNCPVAAPAALPFAEMPMRLDSGPRSGVGAGAKPIYSQIVTVPNADWVRVIFDPALTNLAGPSKGRGAAWLRITSLADGCSQTLTVQTLAEWGFTSAYFNGDAVRVELFAARGGRGRVAVMEVHAGTSDDGGVATICGPSDDRCASSDPRVARIVPIGCTAWLFDNQEHAMLSAGHCAVSFGGSVPQVCQFNVPRSDPDGTLRHPCPDDQYAIDPTSVQYRHMGAGDDWAHFGVFANSQTNRSPLAAQGRQSFVRASASGTTGAIRITGFGDDDGWEKQTNQTHVGPLVSISNGLIRYVTDTVGGNSGGPIIRESDGAAIGIHTNGGCVLEGSNFGIDFTNPGLLAAIANPRGIAATRSRGDLNGDGRVDASDLSIVLVSWGQPCSGTPCADLNGDGIVNASDLVIQMNSWPPAPNEPGVPAWATLIERDPDPAVVTDASLRAAIIATGLPWRVRDNASNIEMLLVPPGTFAMGCSPSNEWQCTPLPSPHGDEGPVHPVTLTCAYYIGRYEVTQAQWQARMGSNPSDFQAATPEVPAWQVRNRPVEKVSWDMIREFLCQTGLRLPTEAEWEYAYRAGTSTAFHSMPGFPDGTNDDNQVGTIAWWGFPWGGGGGNSGLQTRPVGGRAANALGLHDMAGNVWEWVSDRFALYTAGAKTNPQGERGSAPGGTYRILRGGSYGHISVNLRASYRHVAWHSNEFHPNYGFRVARSP